MPYIPPEVVARAREVDLLTYLRNYEPQELVHFGGGTYCTREHDSLKISNGKWCWFSRGIGGYSALDYLIKVKEMPFTQAAETIMGKLSATPPAFSPAPKVPKEKVLLLPQANRSATHAVEYLHRRGIDSLESLRQQALENGVEFIACQMSMDVMGVKREELLDEVTVGGVATYMERADNANINLFI